MEAPQFFKQETRRRVILQTMSCQTLRSNFGNTSLFLVCVLWTCLLSACNPAPKTFTLASGETIDLREHAGKWVFINYWAPWCAPCRKEIPELNELANEYQESALVLGVHLDGVGGERLLDDIRDMDIRFPVLLDDPTLALGLRTAPVVPITWVLDPTAKPHRMLVGPQTKHQLVQVMDTL